MQIVNVNTCELDDLTEQGEFRRASMHLSGKLGSSVIGASIYEMEAGQKRGPYHYHYGFEEWMYVISGAPMHRDPSGDRELQPGSLVAFASGPSGAHTVSGPGRVILFSTGSEGWREAYSSVYLDSDKIGASPGVMFRRSDALDSWQEEQSAAAVEDRSDADRACPELNLLSLPVIREADDDPREGYVSGMELSPLLGAETWGATLHELGSGETTGPYHHEWGRDSWAIVLSGRTRLRHADGMDELESGDTAYFPEGPAGARQFVNDHDETARIVIFTSPRARPLSAFYPADGTVLVRVPGYEAFVFRETDQIDDYWDGEPGAGIG